VVSTSCRQPSAEHESAGRLGLTVKDPRVLAAVISGAVAFAAIVGAVATTWLTLRHQRKADEQRRQHEQRMRLVDSGLKAAVDFLAAADSTTRARQGLDTASISIQQAKSSADEATYQHILAALKEAQEKASAAIADAESAYAAIRMLIPAAADPARRYLDLCIKADAHPDETKVDRQRAQRATEEAIRHTLS
jgi:hypothetical protein